MSANHDIKSQPPAAHFTTILCTKSQHCRFVAARCQQLPHLKKSSSFCGRCWEQFCVFFGPTQRLRFIAWTQLTNSPVLWIGKFLYGRVFLACWLASAGDGRRCSSSLRSCGNSIQGRPPTPPTGHQAHTCKVAPPLASTVPTYGWVRNKIAVLPMENDNNLSPDAMFNSQQRLWAGILTKGYQLNFSMFPQLLIW